MDRTRTRALADARTLMADRALGETRTNTSSERSDERVPSFQRLTDQHLDASYRLARVIVGDRAEAEDAVHDAVVTAWTKWPSLRDPTRFEAWFQRILVNTCRNRLRKTGRRRERPLDLSPDVVSPDALASVLERERMSRAFAELDPDHRIVLALRYYRDLPVDEIARLTGTRSGTVKSRLHRAQKRMRAILSTEGNAR